jgi:hypothetical protein
MHHPRLSQDNPTERPAVTSAASRSWSSAMRRTVPWRSCTTSSAGPLSERIAVGTMTAAPSRNRTDTDPSPPGSECPTRAGSSGSTVVFRCLLMLTRLPRKVPLVNSPEPVCITAGQRGTDAKSAMYQDGRLRRPQAGPLRGPPPSPLAGLLPDRVRWPAALPPGGPGSAGAPPAHPGGTPPRTPHACRHRSRPAPPTSALLVSAVATVRRAP